MSTKKQKKIQRERSQTIPVITIGFQKKYTPLSFTPFFTFCFFHVDFLNMNGFLQYTVYSILYTFKSKFRKLTVKRVYIYIQKIQNFLNVVFRVAKLKSQKNLENPRKSQKILGNPRKFQKILGNSRKTQKFHFYFEFGCSGCILILVEWEWTSSRPLLLHRNVSYYKIQKWVI